MWLREGVNILKFKSFTTVISYAFGQMDLHDPEYIFIPIFKPKTTQNSYTTSSNPCILVYTYKFMDKEALMKLKSARHKLMAELRQHKLFNTNGYDTCLKYIDLCRQFEAGGGHIKATEEIYTIEYWERWKSENTKERWYLVVEMSEGIEDIYKFLSLFTDPAKDGNSVACMLEVTDADEFHRTKDIICAAISTFQCTQFHIGGRKVISG